MRSRMIYLFICRAFLDAYGYSIDKSGANLPTGSYNSTNDWQCIATLEMSDQNSSLTGEEPKTILQAIDKYGYFIDFKGSNYN